MNTATHGCCPSGERHDWVVEKMYGQRDMRAYYHVECANCEVTREGEAHEIPTARFK